MERSLPSSSETSIVLRTRVDCVRHLLATAKVASWATFFGGALVVYWLYGKASTFWLLLWFASLGVLSVVRLIYKHRFGRHFSAARARQWEAGYALLMGALGLTWGMLAWVPAPGQEYQILFCITVILLLSSSTLVASKKTFLAFVVAVLVPLFLAQMMLKSSFALFLGVGSLAMGVVIFVAYRVQYRILVAALVSQHRAQDLLQQLRVVFESAGEGIVFIKPKPKYTSECNRRFAELFGYTLAQMQNMEPWRWHPDRAQWKQLVAASSPVIAQGQAFHQGMRLQRADGSLFWADTTGMAVDAGNLSAGTVWVISDITDKRATEAALRLSEQRFRDLMKISSDLYWEQDAAFRFTKFDGKNEVLQHLPLADYLGLAPWELLAATSLSAQEWAAHRAELEQHQPFRDLIYPVIAPSGHTRWLTASGNPLFDAIGQFIGYHGVSSDITSRVLTEERYRHLAFHDPLTQLPNRRLFDDRLEQAMREASRCHLMLAVLLIDLDGFKRINDGFGHAAGDAVLKAVAERLCLAVRECDTVARLGGDEFVVLLKEVSGGEGAVQVAEKIHQNLAHPVPFDGEKLDVSASIGIALYPRHGVSAPELLAQADAAMYRGKHDGGRRIHLFADHR